MVKGTHALVAVVGAACFSFACNSNSFGSKSDSTDDKESSTSGSRPSEEGEGVVGYLTDPNKVTAKQNGDELTVSAPAGTVAASSGSISSITVCLQQVTSEALQGMLSANQTFGGSAVNTLTSGAVGADGSFSLSANSSALSQAKLLGVNVTGSCVSGASPLDAGNTSLVFKDLTGDASFSSLGTLFPNITGSGSASFHTCSAPSTQCTEKLAVMVEDGVTSAVIKQVTLTFYNQSCPSIFDACTDTLIGSTTAAGSQTVYYSGTANKVKIQANGYQSDSEALDQGPIGTVYLYSNGDDDD